VNSKIWKICFLGLALMMLFPFASSGTALLFGLIFALLFGNPWLSESKKLTPKLLAYSVVGLGATMDLYVVKQVGLQGVGYTLIGITGTLLLGTLLGRICKLTRDTALLISVGTAICGGSAIAAVAPVVRAKAQDISLALITVFLLNAVAIMIFPWLGHHFNLSETQFGLWSALAIHDTSSVVGSAMQYGATALEVATTVKLTRALWIIPVTLAIAWWRSKDTTDAEGTKDKLKKPWFILGFLLVASLVTFIPALRPYGVYVSQTARRLLVLTLFLIGANVPKDVLKTVGLRPLVLGISLWFVVGGGTLFFIRLGWIH
jgi:uncharacterized integral membrane protein (TIGR00698 family)